MIDLSTISNTPIQVEEYEEPKMFQVPQPGEYDNCVVAGITRIDEYVNDKPTGRLKRAGFKNTAYEVQINLRSSKKGSAFQMQIIDCRHDPGLDGTMIEPPTFERLQQMVFTNNNSTAQKEATQ